MTKILTVQGLKKRYKLGDVIVEALKGIDFELEMLQKAYTQ